MKFREWFIALLLGLPALALLALGPHELAQVPTGRTVVRYWAGWTGVEGVAIQKIVQRFNQSVGAEKNIWVEYCAVSNVDQRMLISTAGGDPPDVALLYDYIVAQFAEQGALLPLDDLAREFNIQQTDFKPIWWDIGVYQNRLFALPAPPYTPALFYNKRLFREAGLDPNRPPRTIAEFDDYAAKLTRRGPDGKLSQLGFTLSPAMLGWWHWPWPYFFNGRLWDGEHFTLDTVAGRAAFRWIVDNRRRMGAVGLSTSEATDKAINDSLLNFEGGAGTIEGPSNPFLCEKLAMVYQGPWLANWAMKYAPTLEFGVARFPSVDEQHKFVFASTDVFVIPHGSPHPREAMAFLAWLMRRDVMEELCQLHGKGSPFAQPGPRFYDTHPNPYIRTFDALADSPETFGYPKMPMWTQARDETLHMLETIIRGVRSPDDLVRATQQKVDVAVKEYRRMAELRRGRTAQ